MAQQGAGERTEKPTHRRLAKSREQGKVPSSDELASALVLLTLIVMLWLLGPTLYGYLRSEVRRGICGSTEVFLTNKNFLDFANARIVGLMGAIMPLMLGMTVAGVVGCVAVSGINFAPKALNLKFSGLNPVAGLANLFSVQSLQKLVMALAKIAMIVIVGYMFVRSRLDDFIRLRWASTNEIFALSGSLVFGIFVRTATAILILAIADAAYQKWKYMHDLKMTKQEVKQERREEEGSPEVKRRVRMLQIEMASRRMLQEVPKANVVLVNPTHVAVALKYDPRKMEAPMLLAKGGDHLCEKIKEIARAHGVPIVHRPELARSIFAGVEPGQLIPEALYVAVAEVLAMIYRLRHRR